MGCEKFDRLIKILKNIQILSKQKKILGSCMHNYNILHNNRIVEKSEPSLDIFHFQTIYPRYLKIIEYTCHLASSSFVLRSKLNTKIVKSYERNIHHEHIYGHRLRSTGIGKFTSQMPRNIAPFFSNFKEHSAQIGISSHSNYKDTKGTHANWLVKVDEILSLKS